MSDQYKDVKLRIEWWVKTVIAFAIIGFLGVTYMAVDTLLYFYFRLGGMY